VAMVRDRKVAKESQLQRNQHLGRARTRTRILKYLRQSRQLCRLSHHLEEVPRNNLSKLRKKLKRVRCL